MILGSLYRALFRGLFFAAVLCIPSQVCLGKAAPDIPGPLKPWVKWVLHGQEAQQFCVPRHDNASSLECAWPNALVAAFGDQFAHPCDNLCRSHWSVVHNQIE